MTWLRIKSKNVTRTDIAIANCCGKVYGMSLSLELGTDEELAIVAATNRQAFAVLYDRHAAGLYRWLRWRLNSDDDAWDVVQDVFIKVLHGLPRYDPSQASFRTWLFTIARRRLIDFWRTQKVTVNIDQIEVAVDQLRSADQLDARLQISAILNRLSETERALITLRYEQDLSFKDIARITGKSEGALRAAVHRLKKIVHQPS